MQNLFPGKVPIYVYFFLIAIALACVSCSSDDGSTDNPIDNPGTPDGNVFEENFVLDQGNKLVNYVLSQADYNKFIAGEGDFAMVSNKVYEYFNDDFDFIFILSVETEQPDGLYFGVTRKIKNDVEGIASSIYDNTTTYGSQGALKSIIHMPRTEYVRNGPFLHEIVHYWGNYGLIPTTVGGHWGFASVGGQLGGFDQLTDLGSNAYMANVDGRDSFGTFANGGNALAYGNLELYIMGLIGADELEPVMVAENPVSTGSGTFTADNIRTITAADLIAEHGERVPSVQISQKDFKGITVVISTSKLSEEKIESINTDLENFSRKGAPDQWGGLFNFWQATGERGSLSIDITQDNIK